MNNIPVVKLGLIAVSVTVSRFSFLRRDAQLSWTLTRGELYECPVTVENEKDMEKALEDVNQKLSVMHLLFSLETSDQRLQRP